LVLLLLLLALCCCHLHLHLHAVSFAVEQPLDLCAGAEEAGALLGEVFFEAEGFVHDHHALAGVKVCEIVLKGEKLCREVGDAIGEVRVQVQHVDFVDR
jgi:hypothetical protein